jgi:hypothetical protein
MYQENRSQQQIYRSAVSGLYARIKSYYDFLYEKYGDDGLKLIEDMSRKYGLDVAQRAKKALNDTSINSVARYLLRIFETVTHGKNVVHIEKTGDNAIVIKVEDCPLHFTDPRMCLAHTTMEKTVINTLNPQLNYRIGKSIPAGDSYCEHILEIIVKESLEQ